MELFQQTKKDIFLPTASEESWRRTSPEVFFLKKEEALNIKGFPVTEEPPSFLLPWKICFWELEKDLDKRLRLLEKHMGKEAISTLLLEKKRLVFLDIQDGFVHIYSSAALKSSIEYQSHPFIPNSVAEQSPIGLALATLLKRSSPHEIKISIRSVEEEVPLFILTNHLEPSFAQSYSIVHFFLAQNTQAEFLFLEMGSEHSYFRQEFSLEEKAMAKQIWLLPSRETGRRLLLERKVHLKADAVFQDSQVFVPTGEVRLTSNILLEESKARSESSCVLLACQGKFDYEPMQEHKAANTKSFLKCRMIAAKKSRAIFQGLVKMHQVAQDSEAVQENKNLLLNSTARIDALPRLDILPHRVMCKHGSATAEIDKDQLYYLASRGFSEEQGKRLIMESFVMDAFPSVENETLFGTIVESFVRMHVPYP